MKKNVVISLILGVFILTGYNAQAKSKNDSSCGCNLNNKPKTHNIKMKQNSNKDGISFEQAAIIAAKKAGVHPSQVVELKKDFEKGREVYEGKIYNKGLEYEFEIDVLTGKIVKWEVERD